MVANKLIHVLLVDDAPVSRRATSLVLNQIGIHRIQSISHAQIALSLVQKQAFDLILLDIGLLEISGIDLACMIREEEKKMPDRSPAIIMMLTGLLDKKYRDMADDIGVDAFLKKPLQVKAIREAILQTCPTFFSFEHEEL